MALKCPAFAADQFNFMYLMSASFLRPRYNEQNFSETIKGNNWYFTFWFFQNFICNRHYESRMAFKFIKKK